MKPLGIIYGIVILCLLQICLSSCGDDDLKKAAKLSEKVALNRDRTPGVALISRASAKVKAQGFAPILDKVTPANGAIYQ